MTPPSRRQTLQALGLAVASTAGCLGAPQPGDDSDGNTTDTSPRATPTSTTPRLAPGETYETDDARTIRVSEPAVHPSVVSVEYVSSTHYYERVADAGSGQYLAFVVEVEGFDLPTEDRELYGEPIDLPLAVEVGGERYADPIPVGRDGDPYRDHVAIRVPVVDATDAAVVWAREDGPQPRWELGSDVVEKLAAAPEFEVRDWSVPDRVESGEAFEASVTVANVGGRDGRFLTTLGVKQGSLGLPETSVEVPAGETVTHTVILDPEYVEGGEFRVVLEWGIGRRDAVVEVTGSTGTETETARPAG